MNEKTPTDLKIKVKSTSIIDNKKEKAYENAIEFNNINNKSYAQSKPGIQISHKDFENT